MATRWIAETEVPERTSCRYSSRLTQEDGVPLAAPHLTTLKLTLYATDAQETIINGIAGQDILNTDRGTVGPEGALAITLGPADTYILKPQPNRTETRIMLIEATYAGGTKASRHEVQFNIRNLDKVT